MGYLAAARIEIAPQRGNHPYVVLAAHQRRNCLKKSNPFFGSDPGEEEDLFGLINDQDKTRCDLAFGSNSRLLGGSRQHESSLNEARAGTWIFAKHHRQFVTTHSICG